MRMNDSGSKRTPRGSSGGRTSKPGSEKRDNKARSTGGSKSAGNRGTRSGFEKRSGERADYFDKKSGFDRDGSSRKESSEGRSGERRSSDWSTGGYRVTNKSASKSRSTGFKGFKKDDESAFKSPRRDSEQGFRGQRGDSEKSFRAPRRDSEQGFRGQRGDSEKSFRGPRRDSEQGFRGQRGDSEKSFRAPRRDSEQGFRGQRGDSERSFRAPRRDSEQGYKTTRSNSEESVRGVRKVSDSRAKSSYNSNKGYEKRSSGAPYKKFENVRSKDDEFIKKDVITENTEFHAEENENRVEGRNSVFEAVRSGRPLNKLFVDKDADDVLISRIVAMAREKDVPIQYLERFKLDSMSQTRIHQGVILEVAAQEYVEVEDILKKAAEKEEKPFILILDEITDTNNLGSIIRSAECSGVHGIILPKRRSATLNATVAKVAAGALEYVPVARVTNLVQTLRELKAEGLWIIGADMEGESNYYDADLTGPCALVIGSEGEGLARLVKDECDLMVRIPMKGKISSLNAGVAAALVMFEIAKQRG